MLVFFSIFTLALAKFGSGKFMKDSYVICYAVEVE